MVVVWEEEVVVVVEEEVPSKLITELIVLIISDYHKKKIFLLMSINIISITKIYQKELLLDLILFESKSSLTTALSPIKEYKCSCKRLMSFPM